MTDIKQTPGEALRAIQQMEAMTDGTSHWMDVGPSRSDVLSWLAVLKAALSPEGRHPTEPRGWMVVRKRETDPPEVWTFDRYDEAAMFWDRVQAQWTEVYFCRIAYGPYRQGMTGERPTVPALAAPTEPLRSAAEAVDAAVQATDDHTHWFDALARLHVALMATTETPTTCPHCGSECGPEIARHLRHPESRPPEPLPSARGNRCRGCNNKSCKDCFDYD